MQFPESWLREFCNPPITSQALADLLTMAGMEVEETRPAAPPFSKVVVARVVSVQRHPDADRLNCQETRIGKASPVGLFPRGSTPDGIADLYGNVWEWVGGNEWLGGSCYTPLEGFRGSVRVRDYPDYWFVGVGFRCAREVFP